MLFFPKIFLITFLIIYNSDEVTKDEDKDDESLVSFTEIKLDKMYKKTLTLQNNQRMIEKEKEEIHA